MDRKQKKEFLIIAVGLLVLLSCMSFLLRSCSDQKAKQAQQKQRVSTQHKMKQDKEEVSTEKSVTREEEGKDIIKKLCGREADRTKKKNQQKNQIQKRKKKKNKRIIN